MRSVVAGGVRTFVCSFEGKVLDRIIEAGSLNFPEHLSEREDELARGLVFRGVLDCCETNDGGNTYELRSYDIDGCNENSEGQAVAARYNPERVNYRHPAD